jgi:hypothetical protein
VVPGPAKLSPAQTILALFGAGVLLFGGYSCYSCYQAVHTSSAATAVPTATEKRVAIGDIGVLRSVTPHVVLFENEEDFEAFSKAIAAKDLDGVNLLIVGKGTPVPSGTKARKIDFKWSGVIQVRVAEGPNQGFAGWTYMEDLKTE